MLLIYAGWSVEATFFEGLQCPGYDVAVAYNFSSLEPAEVGKYEEVVLIAWSLGVHAAELTASHLPLTLTLAVNGTPFPVHDELGIPETIYNATADNLTEQSLTKFHRRMGAPGLGLPAGRDIEELKSELKGFPRGESVDFRWDWAIITSADRIFPPDNQRKAWSEKAEITEISGSHTPDFQQLINRFVIDKSLVSKRFEKGMQTYASESVIQRHIADKLFSLWQKHAPVGDSVLEIGVGTGYMTGLYRSQATWLTLWDIAPSAPEVVKADAEIAIRSIDKLFDAIVSASTMQWLNSPGAFLRHCSDALNPGGMLVLSTFGPATFSEMTEAGVIGLPYLGEESLRRIIPRNLEILELRSETIVKSFDTPVDILRHLKATGVNARSSSCSMQELLRRYPVAPDGSFRLTYQPIYLILKKTLK